MAPFPTPDEPMAFKNRDDFIRLAVAISGLAPQPIIGKFRIQIDRRPLGVHAAFARVLHRPAVEGASARISEALDRDR